MNREELDAFDVEPLLISGFVGVHEGRFYWTRKALKLAHLFCKRFVQEHLEAPGGTT